MNQVPDELPASPPEASLRTVCAALEQQLAVLDALGSRVAAAHVSAAVEHLRLEIADAELGASTRH
jgi:hypothetical protein